MKCCSAIIIACLGTLQAFAGEFNSYPLITGVKCAGNLNHLSDSPYELKLYGENRGNYYFRNEYQGPGVNYYIRIYNEFREDSGLTVDARELTVDYKGESFTLIGGRQVISWSETFGLNIMDIVNPRDYSYYILPDLDWTEIPVWLIIAKFFGENWYLEALVNPYGENNKMAEKGTEFDRYNGLPFERTGSSEHNVECGARISYLFDFGLDLSFIYYRHINRNPFYYLNDDYRLQLPDDMVNSYGLTFSHSAGSWVFRGDFLFNQDNPVRSDALGITHQNWYQSIIGADWTADSGLIIGWQVITDSLNSEEWAGIRISKGYDAFEFLIMGITGIDNADRWLRYEITWKGMNSLNIRARFDTLDGGNGSGFIEGYKNNDRLEIEISYLY